MEIECQPFTCPTEPDCQPFTCPTEPECTNYECEECIESICPVCTESVANYGDNGGSATIIDGSDKKLIGVKSYGTEPKEYKDPEADDDYTHVHVYTYIGGW